MKVAIYGGSFNPVHEGHLSVAKQALKNRIADEIWFMPTAYTPLKESEMADKRDRVNMIARAIKPFKRMKLCTYEIDRNITSYTMDTVYYLLNQNPNIEFCWLIGEDQAAQFTKWKDYETLLETIPFYVFSRGTQTIELLNNMYAVPMDLVDISSTEIREGRKLYLCPKSVRNYMRVNNLYNDVFISSKMSWKRYAHTRRVAYLASTLAQIHGESSSDAYLAGMLHDVVKEYNQEELEMYMKLIDPKFSEYALGIWHGFISPIYSKRHGKDVSQRVSNAIMHHVLGTGTTKLAKILYISDKIEPGRNYDTSELIELAKIDLDQAIDRIKEESNEYLKRKGVIK